MRGVGLLGLALSLRGRLIGGRAAGLVRRVRGRGRRCCPPVAAEATAPAPARQLLGTWRSRCGSRTDVNSKTGFGIAWGEVWKFVAFAHHAPKMRRDAWKWLGVIGDFHPFSIVFASLRKPCAETVISGI